MHKISVPSDPAQADLGDQPWSYQNLWMRESPGAVERLMIAPENGHLELLLELAQALECRYWVLYVLLVSRTGKERGRYQSADLLEFAALDEFCRSFGSFLETDGRHHFWIGSQDDSGTLVYDHHNVIYAHGPLQRFEHILSKRGYYFGSIEFPSPHIHNYYLKNDAEEERLLAHWNWLRFPLEAGDEY